jgi:hypothetical protein
METRVMPPDNRILASLGLLLQAQVYSQDLNCDPWEFAVELSCLRDAGLTNGDLRWLLVRGYLLQQLEVAGANTEHRAFRPAPKMRLAERSCFLLSPSGLAWAQQFDVEPPTPPGAAPKAEPPPDGTIPVLLLRPQWDKEHRILRYDCRLIKQFKVPAPNQEIILAAFEEEEWPERIDDPLPLQAALDPKRRLHDTINSLNRNQKNALLRFLGDGSGEGICWKALALTAGLPQSAS